MASSLYTLSALDSAVLSRLEDNSIFFQTAERYTIINEAIKVTNILTGFYQGTLLTISQAGQLVYPTPVGMLYPQRIEFDGIQLDPIPITRIGQDYRTWATDTTAKLGAVARWVPIGINYFCLHPADSNGGSSIAVTGVLEPPVLVLPTDSMTLPDEFASIVVEYCAGRLPLKCGGKSAADGATIYQKSFMPSIKPLLNLQKFSFPRFFVNQGSSTTEGKIQ